MLKNILLSLSAVLFVFISKGFGQDNDSAVIKRIVDQTLTSGSAHENLRQLCKKVGARLSGSAGYFKAVTLTSAQMKQTGADTVYLQKCMVPHWVRGEKEKGTINYSNGKAYNLHLCALGNSVGTAAKGVKSTVVEVNSMQQLKELGNAGVSGKIVFFNFPMNPTYIETFRGYGESGVSRTRGPSLAARYGAIGAIVRSLAINPDDHPHTGVTIYNDSFPKIPAVAISTNDANRLSTALKNKEVSTVYFKTSSRMLPDTLSYNVVGEIRGSEHPEEVITVGGHLDSWDLAEGASDDGTGAVQSMQVLETFKALGIKPRRTIRAVLFSNEENGGRGSQAYLEQVKANKEKAIFALESDAGGFTPRGFGFTGTDAQRAKVMPWAHLLYPYGVYQFNDNGGGSDIGPLKEVGTLLCGYLPDSQRYFDIHHAETDIFENVSRRELLLGAANITALVYLVSEHGL
jgi:carboxypeptidase Q